MKLAKILEEMRYMKVFNSEQIPQEAIQMYNKFEMFRKYTNQLEKIVGWYNKIKVNCGEVEFNLIKAEIENIDKLILKAQTELNWDSSGIFI